MKLRLPPLAILFVSVFVDMVGFGIVVPVLPLYTERFHASPAAIGLLLAVYSGMGFLFSPLVGRLSDRFGRRSVLLFSTVGQSVGFLMMGAANSFGWLLAARVIDGIFGANVSASQAYVADVTAPERRARAIGLLGAAFGLGFICGPLLGGVLSQVSAAAPFWFAAGLSAVNALLIIFLLPETAPRPPAGAAPTPAVDAGGRRSRSGGFDLGAVTPLVAAYFLMMTGFSVATSFFALFTEARFGYGAAENGYIFAGIGVVAVITQAGPLGWLVKRFGEQNLAATGLAFLAASLFGLPLTRTPAVLLLVSLGVALGNSLVNPTINALVSEATDAYRQGQVLGVMQSGASLGRTIGPLLGGWLLSLQARDSGQYGQAPFWTGSLVVAAACLVTATWRNPARRPAPAAA